MLNHSGPFHFGPKVVFIWFFTIFAPTPLSKANEGLQYVDLMACRDFHCEETSPFKYLKFFSQNAEPLRPLPFRPKSGVYLIFYNICPYTPFKGKWELTSISWHVETFIVRKLAHLNIWSFSAKMLNHSGLCHFSPKVVFIWFFTIFAPTPPFKGRWGSGSISWHVETFVVRKLAHLNIWSFSAKMLNHSGPCLFDFLHLSAQKWCLFYFFIVRKQYFEIFPLHPAFKGCLFDLRWGSTIHLMACRDIYCEETSPFKYLKFFSQNAEPLRPLPFRPKSGVYLNFLQYLPLHPFQRHNQGWRPSHGM